MLFMLRGVTKPVYFVYVNIHDDVYTMGTE